jgi:hypothetical protein
MQKDGPFHRLQHIFYSPKAFNSLQSKMPSQNWPVSYIVTLFFYLTKRFSLLVPTSSFRSRPGSRSCCPGRRRRRWNRGAGCRSCTGNSGGGKSRKPLSSSRPQTPFRNTCNPVEVVFSFRKKITALVDN